MVGKSVHRAIWRLVAWQHGVIARWQLLEFGLSRRAIDHRIATGRLYPVFAGVYAVGRPEVSRFGRWMAAVLAAGEGAALSHDSGGALFAVRPYRPNAPVEVSVPFERNPRAPGLRVHRRRVAVETTTWHRIPVVTPVCTLVDLAARLPRDDVEAAVNEADKRDLVDVEALRRALDTLEPRPGIAPLRAIIDRRTFVYTDSALERALLPIARRVGLPKPLTQRYVGSYRVDFIWVELRLIVETDGLRYEPEHVERILAAVVRRLETAAAAAAG